ncbi:MAG TPA: Crp/Fnr family transcriptional regulator [Acidobacteriota bacterium]|nr:Crp/Fnr family transcriptional regulator [Acidobacteriota bacterium]
MPALSSRALLAFPFLTELKRESLHEFDERAARIVRHRGEVLLHRGARVTGMYLIVAGTLRVYALRPDGSQTLLYRVSAGQSCLLATNALLSDVLYPAWVVVETERVEILHAPEAIIHPLYRTEPALREFVLQTLAQRVFDLMTTIEELCALSVEERLRSYLVRRADRAGLVRITHDEIALDLATAREVVSRQLARWRRAGLIASRRGTIKLLAPEKFSSIN